MGRFDLIYHDELPSRAVTVYFYLHDRSNKENTCFPSIKTISKDTKLSVSTVKRALTDLDRAGYISWENRFRPNGARYCQAFFANSNSKNEIVCRRSGKGAAKPRLIAGECLMSAVSRAAQPCRLRHPDP